VNLNACLVSCSAQRYTVLTENSHNVYSINLNKWLAIFIALTDASKCHWTHMITNLFNSVCRSTRWITTASGAQPGIQDGGQQRRIDLSPSPLLPPLLSAEIGSGGITQEKFSIANARRRDLKYFRWQKKHIIWCRKREFVVCTLHYFSVTHLKILICPDTEK
jgi:hypothetical protein